MSSGPFPITIEIRNRDDVAIVVISGKLMGGPDADRLRSTVTQLAESGRKKILLDLGEVPWVNSAGVGILLSLVTNIPRTGARIKFARINERVRSILDVTRISSHLDSYADEDGAMSSFAAPPRTAV
jgi:anti-sigma B factor antagonist